MISIFNLGGQGARGEGIINYRGVVTREFPLWKLTLTGGDLPESGHVMTSMSYARLMGDMTDWLHWHQFGTTPSYGSPGDDDLDDDAEDESADGDGEGFGVTLDCRWPQAVKDAQQRYWAAQKAMEQARDAMGEPVCTMADELQAEHEDLARILGLAVEEVEQIVLRHGEQEGQRAWLHRSHRLRPRSQGTGRTTQGSPAPPGVPDHCTPHPAEAKIAAIHILDRQQRGRAPGLSRSRP